MKIVKIVANKGSKLEQQIKSDYDKKIRVHEEALDFFEKKIGVRPTGIGYIWVFGYTCRYSLSLTTFNKDTVVNPKMMTIKKDGCYKTNSRTNKGKDLYLQFENTFNDKHDKMLSFEPYIDYGIFFMDGLVYNWWEPFVENERYMIVCGSSMLEHLKDTTDVQYTIETE